MAIQFPPLSALDESPKCDGGLFRRLAMGSMYLCQKCKVKCEARATIVKRNYALAGMTMLTCLMKCPRSDDRLAMVLSM